MAREALNITVVILANRSYNVLRGELNKVGVSDPGPTALGILSLSEPQLDWVALTQGTWRRGSARAISGSSPRCSADCPVVAPT